MPADCDFPIQNLPYGVFSTEETRAPRVGVAIGSWILDLSALEADGLLAADRSGRRVFDRPEINGLLELGKAAWTATRARVGELLRADRCELRDNDALRRRAIVPMSDAKLHLPVRIPGYVDFYSSREHATNVGSLFRGPENALPPNWSELPIAYNGRASSVVVSGTPVRRPNGQTKEHAARRPSFGPSRKLDIELETAFIVGTGNDLGTPIAIADAEQHIFGMVLLNDWSARDLQQWEYVPLGPLNSKSFATSISPWIVTLDALEPFRVPGPKQEPLPLAYLRADDDHAFDINLEVTLLPRGARTATTLARSNFKHLYWSMAQQLAHLTVSGCNTRPGDLMGSGTISGPTPDSWGSLLELTWNGRRPIALDGGPTRTFLEDGDFVRITGWCRAPDYRVGFGEVRGVILPAFEKN